MKKEKKWKIKKFKYKIIFKNRVNEMIIPNINNIKFIIFIKIHAIYQTISLSLLINYRYIINRFIEIFIRLKLKKKSDK